MAHEDSRERSADPAAWLHEVEDVGDAAPGTWSPPQVLGLALRYAYGVEALRHVGREGEWGAANDNAEDILFLRDQLAEWLELADEDAFEDLADELDAEVPLPSETDQRLEELYREDSSVRRFIDAEYARFREDLMPERTATWWWLDAELYGRQIH